MNNYVVTFSDQNDDNPEIAVGIRAKLENISANKWIQVFPNQVALQSDLSIKEIYKKLQPENTKTRISIFRFSDWLVNEERSSDVLKQFI